LLESSLLLGLVPRNRLIVCLGLGHLPYCVCIRGASIGIHSIIAKRASPATRASTTTTMMIAKNEPFIMHLSFQNDQVGLINFA
jgi:hypothetical protein